MELSRWSAEELVGESLCQKKVNDGGVKGEFDGDV